ncbi:fused signal recognition particle receptor [Acrasis kona]|uniref:Fused signal recognition particle receptor n=1 Tax=Acrasis kona TaxID=1008807 RepID=A0AAW2YPN0_9EUKA
MFNRAIAALRRTKNTFISGLSDLFSGNNTDADSLKKMEEALYRADVGHATTKYLVDRISTQKDTFAQGKPYSLVNHVRHEMLQILEHKAQLSVQYKLKLGNPTILFVIGVNGAGKTTTIGKIASLYKNQHKRNIVIAAADTNRAAAVDQLKIWGERSDIKVISPEEASASVLKKQQNANKSFNQVNTKMTPDRVVTEAYEYCNSIKNKKAGQAPDLLIVDTAGRLQNNNTLLNELSRAIDVSSRLRRGAPDYVWLVIDGTIGQNSIDQAKVFQKRFKVNGIIVTKLDSSAKGGVVLGIAHELKIPILFVGVGEGVDDLREFKSKEFIDGILGDEEKTNTKQAVQ